MVFKIILTVILFIALITLMYTVCRVNGKYLYQCDSLTIAQTFSAFRTIEQHFRREERNKTKKSSANCSLGENKKPKSQPNDNEYKIGDCIVYDGKKSDGIMIIGSFDFGNGTKVSAARALFGEHHLKFYNSTIRYSGYAPGINKARLATEEEKRKFFSNKEVKEYLLPILGTKDYLKQYVEYL